MGCQRKIDRRTDRFAVPRAQHRFFRREGGRAYAVLAADGEGGAAERGTRGDTDNEDAGERSTIQGMIGSKRKDGKCRATPVIATGPEMKRGEWRLVHSPRWLVRCCDGRYALQRSLDQLANDFSQRISVGALHGQTDRVR